ncbi:MAG: PQQ-binding-like beta-propeller repeat protein [Rubrivivax sp.]|nr:PQQ-binding-like beta-propeller repeat protein [Pyrinomonadaceae bacterium]
MIHNLQKLFAGTFLLSALFVGATPSASAQKKPGQKKPNVQKKADATKPQAAEKATDAQQKPKAQEVAPSILVRWQGKPGVNRYRLQLATDEKFEDIVYDQAVEGQQHLVKGLPSGNYFWRVAAAAAETSAAYTRPERISLTDTSGKVEVANVVMSAEGGWRTATGEVMRLVPAQLRAGAVVDFVGLGTDGRVFAVDGASGISLWTARFSPTPINTASEAKASFAPLVVKTQQGATSVVIATQGGVRALNAETGRELWRATLEGRAANGVATDMDGDGSAEVVVITEDPGMFYVLNGSSGRALANQKLDGETSGMPFPFADANTRGVLLGFKKGRVELRKADGSIAGEVKIDSEVTTAPLIVMRGAMPFLVVGTDNGLWAMSVPELKVLGVIKAEDDAVRGALASADVDGDGSTEIVMVTKRGRVALVTTTDGNVRWYSEGATDAASATFADVNGDGVLDVIVPGGNSFALGFSGRDGSLVMRVEEGGRPIEQKGSALRSLVVAPSLSGGGVLVGGDPARMGLRAVELPKGSVKTASK